MPPRKFSLYMAGPSKSRRSKKDPHEKDALGPPGDAVLRLAEEGRAK